jgi:adenine phosphoribosyltransferase
MTTYLQLIETNTDGRRYDATPLFADYDAFSRLVQDVSKPFKEVGFDYVAGIDALGFILGTALALHFEVGLMVIRKGGKLPVEVDQVYFVDYSGQRKSLELQSNALNAGERVLLVDEWVETGSQVEAAIELIERQAGIVVGIATINIDDNEKTRALKKNYLCSTVWKE